MDILLKAAILSFLPISELRGGIPLALSFKVNIFSAFLVCVISNLLVIPFVFFFMDYFHKYFMRIRFYERFFNSYLERNRRKIESKIGTKWEFWALMLFVLLPLPMTGAWTGTILAWFFNVKRRRAYLAIALGVIGAGIIITLATLGIINVLF